MGTGGLIAEVHRRDAVTSTAGWIHFAGLPVAAAAALLDHRLITAINPWIKPAKFYIATAIFLWTLAWFIGDLKGPRPWIRWGLAIAMLMENLLITLQVVRGVPSHFNAVTRFDGNIFTLMGITIVFNTMFLIWLLILFFRRPGAIPRTYLWGIRLGLVLVILGSLEGIVMVMRLSHTVGLADGGPGLPLIYWSTRGGDLRIAHFMGIHGMQAIPLFGWWMRNKPPATVMAFAAAYAATVSFVFRQAMSGVPLIAGSF